MCWDSPAYRKALANQTDWSKTNIAHFRNMIRSVARITISRGQGRGAALGLVRIRPTADRAEGLRKRLHDQLDPAMLDGVVSMHLIEGDPALSKPLTDGPDVASPGAGDWFVIVEGTQFEAVSAAVEARFNAAAFTPATLISAGTYKLMWDLPKSDI